ncbi:Gfo/Idh/MocA family protein [Labrys wisconsinensis]|uniref:Dehydrogenase n=1 Tax=Labrys wisconsinensis TaxID=425677 RepID=A0ABU0JGL5_9HYPH|nr:Gfo/Idh/MocA family oxidoreductase [Labrys wisconsinensis]MDQ0473436.1 putative dehydrogenase [Labrys wisconsinensis]
MQAIGLIHVGLGGWGSQWALEVLPAVPGVEIAAYVDVDAGARARAEAAGVPSARLFASLGEALAAVEAEGVVAPVRTAVHHAVASQALEAGRHVLLEKPFAATVLEAGNLVALAQRQGRLLAVSQNYRFFPVAAAAADIVRRGTYGAPITVEVDFRRYAPEGYRYPEAYPLLVDMGIHHFDLMRFILGQEPVEVSCRTWNPPGSAYEGAPCAAAVVTFDGGATVTWRGNYLSRGPVTPWSGAWRIDLAEASLAFAWRGNVGARLAGEYFTVTPLGGEPRDLTPPAGGLVDREGSAAAFVEAIRSGEARVPLATGSDNLRSLALCHAAVRSADRGGAPVRIADLTA